MKNSGTKKNFIYNMIYQFFLMFLPLVTMPYVSRILGAEGIGIYSYTYSIAHYFVLFGLLGVENYGNRSIAKVRENRAKRNAIFSEIYSLQLFISLASLSAYLLYTLVLKQNKIFALLQIFYVLSAVFDINWLFFGMEDFKITVTRKIVIKILNVICIFAFVKTAEDLWKYILVLSLGYFVAQSSMWLFAKRYVTYSFCSFSKVKIHFKEFIILFVPIIATSIYRIMDKVMLGSMSTMQQVGYYESSEKLVNVCLCVIGAFGAVMMPRMSNLLGKGKINECKTMFVRSMEIAMFIGCAIFFGIASVSKDFIPIFYGEGYEDCILITSMLAFTVLFITWACIVRMLYLIPAEKNKVYIKSVILGAIVNIVINALLIPRYAAMGAAVGTIAAEISVAGYQTILIRKELDIFQCYKKSIPFIAFGSFMWIILKQIPVISAEPILNLLIKIGVGGVVYLLCSLIYFVLTKNQLLFDLIVQVKKACKSLVK